MSTSGKKFPLNDIASCIEEEICLQLAEDIRDNDGAEVLWWGKISSEGLVNFCEAVACGNDEAVLAHFSFMERGDVVIHNHPSGGTQPSEADLQIASQLSQQGIGFYIINNSVSKLTVVAKPVEQAQLEELDEESLSDILGPSGPLAELPVYEQRPQQQELLKLICRGFNEKLLITGEGGTGIGKSYAYLIPAAHWAVQNKQRVVISTATINLQQQLIEKDIPRIKEICGLDIQAELVKGRSNYLCLRRLKQRVAEEQKNLDLEDENFHEKAELQSIEEWAKITLDGSLSDLSFKPQDGTWSQVCVESDNCLGLRCEFHQQCFMIRARQRAAKANILVVNHHLLFADLALRSDHGASFGYERSAVLPPYQQVILDEAHNIERSAQSYFSDQVSKFSIRRTLRRIYHRRRSRESGLWANFQHLIAQLTDDSYEIPQQIYEIETSFNELDAAMAEILQERSSLRVEVPQRQQHELMSRHLWPQLQRLSRSLGQLHKSCREVGDILEDRLDKNAQQELFEWKRLSARLAGFRVQCQQWLSLNPRRDDTEEESEAAKTMEIEDDRVFWLERKRSRHSDFFFLTSTRLNIGCILQEVLFQPLSTVIMVSATLTIKNSFQYWYSRVGLAGEGSQQFSERLHNGVFYSPFAYHSQVSLLLSSDAPNPSFGQVYGPFVHSFAHEAIEHMQGRSLLLFTSYSALNQCYNYLEENLEDESLQLLYQGQEDSTRLLQRFKELEHSSLLATDSFWEGVDAPGSTLSLVVICRLPFRSPDEPLVAAYSEYLEKQGLNPFFQYSLPEAILRFRQGFGRLMRRSDDHGLVVVLDPRLCNKGYGKQFLDSLPECQIVKGKRDVLMQHIASYAEKFHI